MSGSPLPRRARMGWWGRILLLGALLVIGLAGIALYTEFRLEDVGDVRLLQHH